MRKRIDIQKIKEKLEEKRKHFVIDKINESEWKHTFYTAKKRFIESEKDASRITDAFNGLLHSYKLSVALATLLLVISSIMVFRYWQAQDNKVYYRKSEVPSRPSHKVSTIAKEISFDEEKSIINSKNNKKVNKKYNFNAKELDNMQKNIYIKDTVRYKHLTEDELFKELSI